MELQAAYLCSTPVTKDLASGNQNLWLNEIEIVPHKGQGKGVYSNLLESFIGNSKALNLRDITIYLGVHFVCIVNFSRPHSLSKLETDTQFSVHTTLKVIIFSKCTLYMEIIDNPFLKHKNTTCVKESKKTIAEKTTVSLEFKKQKFKIKHTDSGNSRNSTGSSQWSVQ